MNGATRTLTIPLPLPDRDLRPVESTCISLIEEASTVRLSITRESRISADGGNGGGNLLSFLRRVSRSLQGAGACDVAEALEEALQRCVADTDFGGYGLDEQDDLDPAQEADVVFLCSAFLEALKSAARTRAGPQLLSSRPKGRRGMTMAEKIFAMHDVSRRGFVKPGDIIQVDIDWVLASELSWQGMETVYDSVGRPGIFRNDRFWLAGDHRVEPPLYDQPKVKKLMETSLRAKNDFKMTDFQGFNYTIMHTEFVRERAQPGMLCIGADSHSCSAGAVSCLSIGMGATDVCMPLVTGQTWFSVPKTVNLRLINQPPQGIGGKDTILYILKEFKRNTIAADRVVEFTGPGLQYLSCDARFAIANMCTEFGAVTGIFEADERTMDFVGRRRRATKHKRNAVYFKADPDAEYADTFEIDLSEVESFVAVYPSPDQVVPVTEVAGTRLDGTFIGACTTAEEDLVMGALVLKAGLERGWQPVARGRRLVVPGSKPIRHKLEKMGLLEVYRRAGFKVGVPGCSMCVGQGVDQAAPGEVWMSSQNRNFPNRMGPGSLANLGSAATVAASSFSMTISDPRPLLEAIDPAYLLDCLDYQPLVKEGPETEAKQQSISYSEPYCIDSEKQEQVASQSPPDPEDKTMEDGGDAPIAAGDGRDRIDGRVLPLGDFIDTDAIIPSKFLAGNTTNESLGAHCMEFFMPEFRQLVRDGLDIVVGGEGFGCGSSRDVAVNALLGAGVRCVIAKSFAFIYARNQPNIGLLGITIADDDFYRLATRGADISIDLTSSQVYCGGKAFAFQLSAMEKSLIAAGGLTEAFKKFGTHVFDALCQHPQQKVARRPQKKADDIESIGLRKDDWSL